MADVGKLQELLEQLVKFRTTADNRSELERCAGFIANFLSSCKGVVVKRYISNGKFSIVATLQDTKKPEIFLNAHFDVVPAASGMFTPRVKGGKLYGRGSLDCKAQVAVLMMLIKELSSLKQRPNVGVMLTSDEEVGGEDGVKSLLGKEGYSCKFALVTDSGNGFDVVTKHKALLHIKISASGKSAHGSRPWLGDNAADRLIDTYSKVKKLFPSAAKLSRESNRWLTTMSLGKIAAGDVVNKVPDYAEMLIDIRYTEKDSGKGIFEKIRSCCGNDAQVEVLRSSPLLNTPRDNAYVLKLKSAAETVLKRSVRLSEEHGSTDGRHFASKGIPVALMKSIGNGAHSSEEYVELESTGRLYEILRRLILSCSP